MKRVVFVLVFLLLSFLGWTVSHQWSYPIHYEWADRTAPGSNVKSIQGSLTRQALYPRGLSLNVAFQDGERSTWIGDASMAPAGLVERADGIYLVLHAWGRPHGEVKSGQAPSHLVCQLRDGRGVSAVQGGVVTPLFLPSDVPHNIWPWVSHVQVAPAQVDRFQRAAERELAAQVASTVAAGAGACPDLRRAKNI